MSETKLTSADVRDLDRDANSPGGRRDGWIRLDRYLANRIVAHIRAADDGFEKIEELVRSDGRTPSLRVFEIARAHRLAAGRVE